jgi:hypothetical protein
MAVIVRVFKAQMQNVLHRTMTAGTAGAKGRRV